MTDRTAVLVVHGISPQQRYAIQDEFAEQLCSRLNGLPESWGFAAPPDSTGTWQASVYFPPIEGGSAVDDIRPTVVRIHKQSSPDVDDPHGPIIDVFEGYWSPIDKNQTKAASVVTWILRNLFVPSNTAARLYANFRKTLFDLAYFVAALVIVGALTYAIVAQGTAAYRHYANTTKAAMSTAPRPADIVAGSSPLVAVTTLMNPQTILSSLPSRVACSIAVSLVASFLLVQGLVGLLAMLFQWSRFWEDLGVGIRRFLLSSGLVIIGTVVLFLAARMHLSGNAGPTVGTSVWLLAGCVLSFRLILSMGQSFLVNFFGDIQIYCTHDENSKFFTLRQDILTTVEGVLARIVRTTLNDQPFYSKVVVVAHSLGSTISMDALLNLHNLVEEGGLTKDQWRRIRAFVTLGTALEKTKFFFDAQNPTLSASYEQWRNDLYGHLFTDHSNVLTLSNNAANPYTVGIYWANYWYFTDIVANEIDSYRSDVQPGHALTSLAASPTQPLMPFRSFLAMKSVCQNARLGSRFLLPNPLHVWVHSDYLSDDNFWRSGMDRDQKPYHGLLEILLVG